MYVNVMCGEQLSDDNAPKKVRCMYIFLNTQYTQNEGMHQVLIPTVSMYYYDLR